MCGGCDGAPSLPLINGRECCQLGVHVNDVIYVTEWEGARERLGYFEEIDARWGIAVVWAEDGSRTWYSHKPCESPWSSVRLTNPEEFCPGPNFVVAPKEPRWLPHPPPKSAPRRARVVRDGNAASSEVFEDAGELLCQPIDVSDDDDDATPEVQLGAPREAK